MTLRFSTSRAIGAAIALTLGSVSSVVAQQPTSGVPVRKDAGTRTPSTSGMPVTKDTPSTPAPAPAQSPTMPMSTPVDSTSTTTTSSSTVTTTTTTMESTGEVPAMRNGRFGNGFYVGLGAGANFPQNDINAFYKTGYNVNGQIGWDPMSSPLGLRLNVNWNRLNGQRLANQRVGNTNFTGEYRSSDLYTAMADAKLRLPFGRTAGSTSGLYAVGGGGVAYFRNFQTFSATTGTAPGASVTNRFNAEDVTRFAGNVGGGFELGVGPASLFVEGRYVRVFTQNRNTDYVPVTIGLTFH